jgi:hypothetical protein
MLLANACGARAAMIFALIFANGPFLAWPVLARDGINGCSIAEVEMESGPVWRHTIEVQVPEGGYCRVYIGDDKDRKTWTYCWLKRAADNPVQETCDDPLDDEDFDGWKAKAVCGGQNFMAYCRREKPLIPLPR